MTVEQHGPKRQVALSVDLPGTPEQVWQAIATGPGISAWFAPTTFEEHVGGAIRFDLGSGDSSSGRVSEWSPPHRLRYEEAGWAEGAPPLASEWTVAAQAGGGCTLRLVHSLFTTEARWDEELGSMEKGWPGFFRVLRLYLARFPGQAAATFGASAAMAGAQDEVWARLQARLGLSGAQAGDRVQGPAEAPSWAGEVEGRGEAPPELCLILQEPAPGLALWGAFTWGGEVRASLSFYLYGPEAEATAAQEAPKWQAWLDAQAQG